MKSCAHPLKVAQTLNIKIVNLHVLLLQGTVAYFDVTTECIDRNRFITKKYSFLKKAKP